MSNHNWPFEGHGPSLQIVDPGDAGTITIDRQLAVVPLVSAGAETRTLDRPKEQGIVCTLSMYTDGGDITLTVTGGYNETGDTVFTFDDAGEFATFVGLYDGTNYYWRLISHHGIGDASPAEFGALNGLTATAAEINQHSDESTRTEVVTATNVITAAESGKTFFLDAAAGFLSTLPAPAAGLEFEFIVKTAVTSNGYTIATNGGADIIIIGVNELEVDTSDDGPYDDNADLITLVANIAVPGDFIKFRCDGTNWYARGQTNADGGITTGTT